MLKVLLLDNESKFLQTFSKKIKDALEKRGYSTDIILREKTENALKNLNSLDLAFVELDSANWLARMQTAIEIHRCFTGCSIIIVTSYLELATEIFEAEPMYFMLKSQMDERLDQALDLFQRGYAQRRREIIVVSEGKRHIIPLSDLVYCEREGRRTKLVMTEDTVMIWESISKIMERLPEDMFTVCHKSYIVGMQWILRYNSTEINLRTGQQIPISRSYRDSFREKIGRYLNTNA